MPPESWPRTLPLRIRSWFRRSDVEQELDEELAYHVAQLTEVNTARGLSDRAARNAALKQLGSVQQVKEDCRDTWHVRALDQLRQDAGLALRMMRRRPGVTITTLLTLAIAIGANTAVFSMIDGVLFKSPYPDADRIVWVVEKTPRGDMSAVAGPNYRDWQRDNDAFETLGSWGAGSVTLGNDGVPVPLRTTFASAEYFRILGLAPEIGRVFRPEESTPGHDRVAILSHQLWMSRFGGAANVLGQSVTLSGEPYTIVGVLPAGATHGEWSWTEIWLPHTIDEANSTREYRSFNVYGKLRSGVSLAQARVRMDALAVRLGEQYPATNKGWGVLVAPFNEMQVNPAMRQSLYLLLAAVLAVLLIGAVNLANLLLATSLAREREASIRAALGGGWARLLRQCATESLIVSAIGGGLGLLTAYGLLVVLKRALPPFSSAGAPLPPSTLITIDARVLLFALALSFAIALLVALVPARAAMRANLTDTLRTRSGGEASGRTRRLLVVAEVALAFVLLTSAALMVQSFEKLRDRDTGFDSTNVLTATIPLPTSQSQGDPAARQAYFSQLLSQIGTVPGVRDAALTSVLPLQGWGSELPFQAGSDHASDPAQRPRGFFKMVSPDYFRTLGLRIVSGRALSDADRAGGLRVAVINETLARKYFGGRDPIGASVVMPEISTTGRSRLGADIAWQVIGVVADEQVLPPHSPVSRESPGVYVSLAQSPTRRPALVVRTDRDPLASVRAIRQAVAQVNGTQVLADVRTLDAIKDAALGSDRQRAFVLGAFAVVSTFLAAVGIYGVLSYAVSQRTRELGVRAAMGAGKRQLLELILKDGMGSTLLGLAIGLVAAIALSRLWAGLLFGVSALDPAVLLLAGGALAVVAFAACVVPARRASRVDPLHALRFE